MVPKDVARPGSGNQSDGLDGDDDPFYNLLRYELDPSCARYAYSPLQRTGQSERFGIESIFFFISGCRRHVWTGRRPTLDAYRTYDPDGPSGKLG